MEAAYAIAGGIFAGLGAWALLPHGARSGEQVTRNHAVVRRKLIELLTAIGSVPAIRAAISHRSFRTIADEVARKAAQKGIRLSVEQAASCVLLGASGVVICCGLLSLSALGSLIAVIGCMVGLPTWSSSIERHRRDELSKEMPDVFRSLAGSLGAGQTLSQAIDYVGSHERGPAAGEFARASLGIRCGASVSDALDGLAASLDAPGVGLLASALTISQRTGSPLRSLLLQSAELVEKQGELERELRVKTAQVRLSVRIVCAMPVAMISLLTLISQDFQKGLSTGVGVASVIIACLLDASALFIINRLMKGVL